MTSPTGTPPPSDPNDPSGTGAPGGPDDPDGQPPEEGSGIKRWIPAIALGVVLLILAIVLIAQAIDGDSDSDTSTTSTSSTSTSSTSSTTSTSTTTTAPTTAPPTTAPPTTAPPTTAPPTTAPPTTAPPTDEGDAALISQCGAGDEFACYQAGERSLEPPPGIGDIDQWTDASDDDVASACSQDLVLSACYVAGTRGLELTD
jgi:hypothetical protein